MQTLLEKFEAVHSLAHEMKEHIINLHSMPHDFGVGVDLFVKEIHTIEAIGKQPNVTITQLAKQASVTKGAVSQVINKLVDKGLVVKERAAGDGREVSLVLTDLGRIAFREHHAFHEQVFKIVCDYYGDKVNDRLDEFIAVMSDFNAIMKKIHQAHRVK